ncbi:MAG: GAF domain-containing protein, partial [Deltaproteobacteria bacterium]|nr:GAF domain-containing protein [Deltaproteobacteria bacterium]
RLRSFSGALAEDTQRMMHILVEENDKSDLLTKLPDMTHDEFVSVLDELTEDAEHFLEMLSFANNEAFESMLDQMLEAFALKMRGLLQADRVTLYLVDEERGELWSKVTESGLEIRQTMGRGIAGWVAAHGETLNIQDAYESELFDPSTDQKTGYRTRSVLCVPIQDGGGKTFAVAQFLNKTSGVPFDEEDERRFDVFTGKIGILLKSWWEMNRVRGAVDAV